jgi:hypothetical protein
MSACEARGGTGGRPDVGEHARHRPISSTNFVNQSTLDCLKALTPASRLRAPVMIFAGIALFLITMVALHVLQPAYDPVHQLMSELALGPFGGAMVIAFGGLAVAVLGVQFTLLGPSPLLRTVLLAAALSFLAAGVFPLGATSQVHIAAIAVAFVLSVLAMYLYPSSARSFPAAALRSISWLLAAGVALSAFLGHSVLPMGIAQRFAAFWLVGWFAVIGWIFLTQQYAAQQPDAADAPQRAADPGR